MSRNTIEGGTGLLALIRAQLLKTEHVQNIDLTLARAVTDQAIARVCEVVRDLDAIQEYVSEHEDHDKPSILWRIRSLLTPQQDRTAYDQFAQAMRGVDLRHLPAYEDWYDRHIRPDDPEPSPRERFEAALGLLKAAGHTKVVGGLLMSWRGTQNAAQQEQAAALAEAAAKGALGS